MGKRPRPRDGERRESPMEAQLLNSAGVFARELNVGQYDTRRGNSCLYLHALLGYAWLLGVRGGPPRAYQDVPQVPPAAPRAPLLVAWSDAARGAVAADIAVIRARTLDSFRVLGDRRPGADCLGRAARTLRNLCCEQLLSEEGREMYIDSYPPGPGTDYVRLVRDSGNDAAAESLQLMHVAKMLNVRIHVTTQYEESIFRKYSGPKDPTGSVRKIPIDSISTDSTGKLHMIQYNVTLCCDIVCII